VKRRGTFSADEGCTVLQVCLPIVREKLTMSCKERDRQDQTALEETAFEGQTLFDTICFGKQKGQRR
jgi:hypothetical protein